MEFLHGKGKVCPHSDQCTNGLFLTIKKTQAVPPGPFNYIQYYGFQECLNSCTSLLVINPWKGQSDI